MKRGMFEKKDRKILLFLSVLLVLTSINFILAQSVFDNNPISDWFIKWEDAQLSANIVKYLLWVVISIIVWAIGSKIPGLGNLFKGAQIWLGAILSLIIGFLAMAYITPDEVYAIMISYSAFGFTIGAGLPFAVLLTWTIILATEGGKTARGVLFRKIFAYTLWVGFLLFMVYRVFIALGTSAPIWYIWTIIGISILSLILVLGGITVLFKKVGKIASQTAVDTYESMAQKSAGKVKADAKVVDEVTSKP